MRKQFPLAWRRIIFPFLFIVLQNRFWRIESGGFVVDDPEHCLFGAPLSLGIKEGSKATKQARKPAAPGHGQQYQRHGGPSQRCNAEESAPMRMIGAKIDKPRAAA